MRTNAASKQTFFAPEPPQTAKIFDFIDALAERRGFTPEPQFFFSEGTLDDHVEIPPEVYEILVKAVHAMRSGRAVTITPNSHTLTTQQAAEVLGVTRPTLVKILDEGMVPFENPGTHRRVQLGEVLAYKKLARTNTTQHFCPWEL